MTALTLLHTAPALEALTAAARAVATAGAVTGEIVTAGALLWALNGTATAIRTTHAAGAATRRLVDATLIPAADWLSWAAAQVDWAEAARTAWACLLAIGCAAYVAGEATGRAWRAWHTDWVGTIDWTPAEIPAPVAPVALPSRAQTIARLRADGLTWRAIGAHYGVSHTTARRWSLQAA